jgi:hypothetical protein
MWTEDAFGEIPREGRGLNNFGSMIRRAIADDQRAVEIDGRAPRRSSIGSIASCPLAHHASACRACCPRRSNPRSQGLAPNYLKCFAPLRLDLDVTVITFAPPDDPPAVLDVDGVAVVIELDDAPWRLGFQPHD